MATTSSLVTIDIGGRYAENYSVLVAFDPLTDVITFVEALTSLDYLANVIKASHGFPDPASRSRARQITPYIKTALRYLEQSLSGPKEVAFVPTYYSLLNLAKAYILLGPRHAELPAHQLHGASYKPNQKVSHSLLTERISLYRNGAIPLFYETLTGKPLPFPRKKHKLTLSLDYLYPFISDVSAEYELATAGTGKPGRLLGEVKFFTQTAGNIARPIVKITSDIGPLATAGAAKLLTSSFVRRANALGHFAGRPLVAGPEPERQFRDQLRTCLIYNSFQTQFTPLSRRRMLFPEEFPIILAFYHLSSVARYNPVFLEKLRDSRFWPVVSAAQRYSILRMLILFWSFVHQRNLIISRT